MIIDVPGEEGEGARGRDDLVPGTLVRRGKIQSWSQYSQSIECEALPFAAFPTPLGSYRLYRAAVANNVIDKGWKSGCSERLLI